MCNHCIPSRCTRCVRMGHGALVFVTASHLIPTGPCQPHHEASRRGRAELSAGRAQPNPTAGTEPPPPRTGRVGQLLGRDKKQTTPATGLKTATLLLRSHVDGLPPKKEKNITNKKIYLTSLFRKLVRARNHYTGFNYNGPACF